MVPHRATITAYTSFLPSAGPYPCAYPSYTPL